MIHRFHNKYHFCKSFFGLKEENVERVVSIFHILKKIVYQDDFVKQEKMVTMWNYVLAEVFKLFKWDL